MRYMVRCVPYPLALQVLRNKSSSHGVTRGVGGVCSRARSEAPLVAVLGNATYASHQQPRACIASAKASADVTTPVVIAAANTYMPTTSLQQTGVAWVDMCITWWLHYASRWLHDCTHHVTVTHATPQHSYPPVCIPQGEMRHLPHLASSGRPTADQHSSRTAHSVQGLHHALHPAPNNTHHPRTAQLQLQPSTHWL